MSREQHSAEHLNGGSYYRAWTTEELIEEYAWEAKRISREDAERTKRSIKAELKRRFNATLELLDDEQTEESPEGTYRYLLGV